MVLPHPTPPYMYNPCSALRWPEGRALPCSPEPDLINVLSSLNLRGQQGTHTGDGRGAVRAGRGGLEVCAECNRNNIMVRSKVRFTVL